VNLQSTPTAYAMSGCVVTTRYINDLTADVYGTLFICIISSGVVGAIDLDSFSPGSMGVITGAHSFKLNHLSISVMYCRCDRLRQRDTRSHLIAIPRSADIGPRSRSLKQLASSCLIFVISLADFDMRVISLTKTGTIMHMPFLSQI